MTIENYKIVNLPVKKDKKMNEKSEYNTSVTKPIIELIGLVPRHKNIDYN